MSAKKESVFVAEKAEGPAKKGGAIRSLLVKFAFILVALVAIGVGIYYYLQFDKAQKLLKNPTLAAQNEQQSLVDKVGKLIDLPKDEQPTIATVSDVTKLKDQKFFAKAQNGYKVLIYSKAQKAILYDPKANKIIEVGPIDIGNQPSASVPSSPQSSSSSASASPTVSPTPSSATVAVGIYNGTKTAGLAGATEKQLKEKFSNINVVVKGNAKADHTKTLVVDFTGKQKAFASQLAKFLNGEVASLPADEAKPASADILVILGK